MHHNIDLTMLLWMFTGEEVKFVNLLTENIFFFFKKIAVLFENKKLVKDNISHQIL